MHIEKEKLYQIYHTILCLSLTWVLTLAVNQYYQLRVPSLLCIVFSFFPPWFIYLFDLNKKNVVSYLLVVSILPMTAIVFWIKKQNPFLWMKKLVDWCRIYDGTKEKYAAPYAYFLILAVCFAGALLFYLLTRKQTAKIILAALVLATLIVFSINKMDMNKAIVGSSIFYLLAVIVEFYGRIYSKKTGRQEKREAILYLVPICLLMAVLSVCFPSKAEPIQWNGVKYVYTAVKDQIVVWKTELEYYFGNSSSEFFITSGYSEDGNKLSNKGGVVKSDKVALNVTASSIERPIYLIGSVSDTYTGSSWEKSRQDYIAKEEEYLLDYYEMVYALSRQDVKQLENNSYLQRVTINTEYNHIVTKTFFYPLKTAYYEFDSKYKRLTTDSSNITFLKTRGKGTSYATSFYEMNLQGDAFRRMLREADSFDYDNKTILNQESAKWILLHVFANDDTTCLSEEQRIYQLLKKRAEIIDAQYTELPERLPARVRDLAEEITADYDTSYDKLKAIEEYLWNYTYTLQPEKVPEGEDFTDYFLFESREGYCTSYATAMAVLGRCIGIPTRYVEGFIVNFKEKGKNGKYLVRNRQAHAWAEAYIEGIGWIPFEATANFSKSRYKAWVDPSQKGNGAAGSDAVNTYEEYMQKSSEMNNNSKTILAQKEDHSNEWMNAFLITVSAILLLFFILMIYYYILKYRYWKTFQKADNSKKMYLMFLRILSLLGKEGFELEQQETIWMLAGRVKDRYLFDQITFLMVATVFMQYRYADMKVTKEELEQVVIFQRGLAKKQKSEHKKIRLWLEELIFLMKNSNDRHSL